jgi:small-conductance mechanosensitive channel
MPQFEVFDGSIKYIIIAVIVLGAAFVISKILRAILQRFVDSSSKFLRVDPTNYAFFKNAVSLLVFTIAFIVIFFIVPDLRTLGYTLFASAGILTVIVGFASQQAFSNIVSGAFIVIFKPFRVGDYIHVGTFKGQVEDITLRHTVIRDFEYRRVVMPNSVISNETVQNGNLVDDKVRVHVEFGISYDSDMDIAIDIIREEALKHPNCIDNRTKQEKKAGTPKVEVRVINLGDFAVTIRAWVWAPDPMSAFELKTDMFKSVKERFDAEGVEIPFPYRTLVYKKDLKPNKKRES